MQHAGILHDEGAALETCPDAMAALEGLEVDGDNVLFGVAPVTF